MITFRSPADGDIIKNPDIAFLRILILYVGEEYWSFGSGQGEFTYVENDINNEIVITYSEGLGFFLEFDSNNEPVHVSLGKGNFEDTVSPEVGGDPWLLPTKFFVTHEETLLVIEEFLKTRERTSQITWGIESEQNWHYGYED